jgi:hypothetical protein
MLIQPRTFGKRMPSPAARGPGETPREPGGARSPAVANASKTEAASERPILCAACAQTITTSRESISVDGAHEHEVMNPEGITFRIRCFARAPGTLGAGEASEVWTWFPGFAWRVALCCACLTHIGWSYEQNERSFYGLIADRLIEAPGSNNHN